MALVGFVALIEELQGRDRVWTSSTQTPPEWLVSREAEGTPGVNDDGTLWRHTYAIVCNN